MTGWCNRIIKTRDGKYVTYSICEVFHNEKGIMGHGDACLEGDNIKELRYNYKMIAEAFDHPIIVYDEKKEKYFENGKEIKIVRLEAKNVTKFKFKGGKK